MNTARPVIALAAVISSQIAAIGYDEPTQTLAIQFNEKEPTGRTYYYAGVPPEQFEDFKGAASKGSFFHRGIKGHYAYTRVESDGTVSKVAEANPPQPEAA